MMQDLIHFSREPLSEVRSAAQDNSRYDKPCGLWVSVGGAWAEWCAAEAFALDCFQYATRVVLREDASVLRLATYGDIDEFARVYRLPTEWSRFGYRIDWIRVASEYDGILIAPYSWTARQLHHWYYSWDVASGCLWNPRCVDALECVPLDTGRPSSAATAKAAHVAVQA